MKPPLGARALRLVPVVLSAAAACSDAPTASAPEGAIDLAAPWVTVEPAEVGMDAAALETAAQRAGEIERVRSLLVVRRGRLALERYYGGFTADSLSDVRSVTKSIVSALTGIALDRGDLRSIDQPLAELVVAADYAVPAYPSSITVRHLLTMTTGWSWHEVGGPSYGQWILSGDHVGYLLEREVADAPGTRFVYNSAATHVLGVALEAATGRSLVAFADEALFGPLGIDTRVWEDLLDGQVNGGAGIDLRPRDLARFGQLFLQEGWSGSRSLVPEAWVEDATEIRIGALGGYGPIGSLAYGYLWWIDVDRGAFFAWGHGGQLVYVVPRLELVVVSTNDWRGASQDIGVVPLTSAVMEVIVHHVVPAAG